MVLSSIFAAIPSRLAHLTMREGALTSFVLKLGTRTLTVARQCRNSADIPPDDSLAVKFVFWDFVDEISTMFIARLSNIVY
jgi:hypothetical protein